jgi:Caspase domain.
MECLLDRPNEAVIATDQNADRYNMHHPHRGHAVIFNHDKFDYDFKPRAGSEHDVTSLHATFDSLGFQVIIHNNLDIFKIKETISKCKYTLENESISFC